MDNWSDFFIEALHKKYPKKVQLVAVLMELLGIEKESAYRRLRKEIVFSVPEIVKIASAWNISLDELIGVKSSQIFFKVQMLNYINPSDEELNYLKTRVHNLNNMKKMSDMEYMEIANKLPRAFAAGFPYIGRFCLLQWLYQYADEEILPFSKVFYPENLAKISSEFYTATKNIPHTSYIWDHMLFNCLIQNIRYFHSVYLITDEEKELIKNDLHALLDYMLKVAIKGCWLETGNEVNLYISQIHVDTNYSYYYSKEIKICRVHAFSKEVIYTKNTAMVENFKKWMQLKKRATIQISQTNEKSRIEFFMKQHKLVDAL